MSLQLFIKFFGTVIELLLPYMLSKILDDIVPTGNMPMIWLWGLGMILCAAGALAGNVVANRMSTRISANFTRQLRHDLFEQVGRLSCEQTDRFTAPSLISRLTTDTYNVHNMVDRMQRLGVRAPILLIGGIAVTLSMEPALTLVLIAILPLLAVVVWQVTRHGIPLYGKTQEAMDQLVRKVQENMTGVRVIKALSKSEYEQRRFDRVNQEVCARERRAERLMAITNPTMNFLLNAGLTLVMVVGAFRVNGGLTKPGVIIAFLSYFQIILNALMMVTRLFVMYSKGAASARRIAEVLDTPEGMPLLPYEEGLPNGAYLPAQEKSPAEPPHIEFRHVSFSYNKRADNLTDISFALGRGQTLGILGPTGSGKSTLLQLLLRFYDPDQGEILLDGRPVSSIPREILHTKFGVVFQNDFLYADTIRENIDFGRTLGDGAVERAAQTAQADYILAKEEGFLQRLTVKGANLSGGQKQRLLIARALAAGPEILLLDDCSSALDYKTDAALRGALRREYPETTTVIVAQRVSSVLHADWILVLEDGAVVGSGSHETLLATCPAYGEIYQVQMGEAIS